MRKLRRCPVAILMGCSSGVLRAQVRGCPRPIEAIGMSTLTDIRLTLLFVLPISARARPVHTD